ncbi:MAG: phosphoribosylanthranilate isomerase [Oscillospiraceae bacterium]|nr:phosphoribosylanthranilate isomerase [Oscillospiraceae bacterium]
MITQIYSLQYPDEATDCVAAGVDHIGLLTGDDSCPAAITLEQAKLVFNVVGKSAVKSAILMYDDEETILSAARYLQPDIIHLCGTVVFATPEFCARARAAVPDVRIMQAIAVGGPETMDAALAQAKRYDGVADILLLDSVMSGSATAVGSTPNGVGAAGVTHDWNISARIVRETRTPVILAGGLSADNVAAAIQFVRPWGVDSLTKTSVFEEGKCIRKDTEKVRAFVQNAKSAAAALGL